MYLLFVGGNCMADYDKAENKARQAYAKIKEKILTLEFLPCQPLREIELSEQLSMSRTPVRAAIAQLISEGFVEEIGPKRNIVSDVSADSFMAIYQVREVLENLCVSLATYAWQDPKEIEKVRDHLKGQLETVNRPPIDSRALLRDDRRFHGLLAEMTRNKLLVQEMMRVYDLYWRYNFYLLHTNRSYQIVMEHMEILEAVEQRNANLAQARMKSHLSYAKDATLLGLARGFDPTHDLGEYFLGST